MRSRHFQPFPFTADMAAGNAAAWEPFTFSLKESMEYWWRLRTITVACTFTATCDDIIPADQRTYSRTLTCTRYSAHTSADIADGSELELIGPGPANGDTADFRGSHTELITDWLESAGDNFISWSSANKMFTPGSASSRGTWLAIDPFVVKPSVNFGFTVSLPVGGSVLNPPSLTVSNINPGAGANTGSFSLTFFGSPVTFYWTGNPGDYSFNWDSVSISAITKTGWFSYAQTGAVAPVWDSATGAQNLDPRTASVP